MEEAPVTMRGFQGGPPKTNRTCPKQGMVTRLSSLNFAYTVFSNPRSEAIAGL